MQVRCFLTYSAGDVIVDSDVIVDITGLNQKGALLVELFSFVSFNVYFSFIGTHLAVLMSCDCLVTVMRFSYVHVRFTGLSCCYRVD